jgi:hypothetical protein
MISLVVAIDRCPKSAGAKLKIITAGIGSGDPGIG